MKKRITRLYKTIIAEVVNEVPTMSVGGEYSTEIIVDKKFFSRSILMYNLEPNEETYKKANAWADGVIRLHEENTNSTPVKGKNEIMFPDRLTQIRRQVTGNPDIERFYNELFSTVSELLIQNGMMTVKNNIHREKGHSITYTLCLPKLPIGYIDRLLLEKKEDSNLSEKNQSK